MLRAMSTSERRGFGLDVGTMLLWLVLGPLLLMGSSVLLVTATSTGRQFLQGVLADERVQALIGTTGMAGLLREAVLLRLTNPLTYLLVAVLITLLWYLLQRSWVVEEKALGKDEQACSFSYLVAAVAFLLTLVVEVVYLRDLFMTRMNTVFKLYYQAWVMMAVAAAFGAYYMVGRGAPKTSRAAALGRYVWATALLGLVLAGMVYPVLAIPNKAGDFEGEATLDGMAFLEIARPDDYAAIRWLQENVYGISYIVESSGGSYSDSAFISAFTGLPTVLGWDFHEYQWRGSTQESSKREPEVAKIYQSADSQQVLALLDKYDVDYVYVGPVEKRKYSMQSGAGQRFERFLTKVYDEGAVRIYRR
jgi:YYY domain-containing protein